MSKVTVQASSVTRNLKRQSPVSIATFARSLLHGLGFQPLSFIQQGLFLSLRFYDFIITDQVSPSRPSDRQPQICSLENPLRGKCVPVSESLLLNTLGSRPESLPQSEIYFKLKLFLKGRQKKPWYHPSINLQIWKRFPQVWSLR